LEVFQNKLNFVKYNYDWRLGEYNYRDTTKKFVAQNVVLSNVTNFSKIVGIIEIGDKFFEI
jgi:hypothetical protein